MDVLPQVSLFGHSFVKRLAAHAEHRGDFARPQVGCGPGMSGVQLWSVWLIISQDPGKSLRAHRSHFHRRQAAGSCRYRF